MLTNMPVIRVWIATPVDYLYLPDEKKSPLLGALLDVEGVSEVEYYSEVLIRCDITCTSDEEMLAEIQTIRARVEQVFTQFDVWNK